MTKNLCLFLPLVAALSCSKSEGPSTSELEARLEAALAEIERQRADIVALQAQDASLQNELVDTRADVAGANIRLDSHDASLAELAAAAAAREAETVYVRDGPYVLGPLVDIYDDDTGAFFDPVSGRVILFPVMPWEHIELPFYDWLFFMGPDCTGQAYLGERGTASGFPWHSAPGALDISSGIAYWPNNFEGSVWFTPQSRKSFMTEACVTSNFGQVGGFKSSSRQLTYPGVEIEIATRTATRTTP